MQKAPKSATPRQAAVYCVREHPYQPAEVHPKRYIEHRSRIRGNDANPGRNGPIPSAVIGVRRDGPAR